MTIPPSTIPGVKAALVAGITTAVNDPDVLVCYDEPGPNMPDDIVVVGRVDRQIAETAMVGSGGAGWLDERYTIQVIVSCYRGGDDPQTVDERALALEDIVDAFVRGDPSLGGRVVTAYPSGWTTEGEWEPEHKGRLATGTGLISCLARI